LRPIKWRAIPRQIENPRLVRIEALISKIGLGKDSFCRMCSPTGCPSDKEKALSESGEGKNGTL
jgi:hypothetical protein